MAMKVIIPITGHKESRGTIGMWFKRKGDPVQKGEPLCTVETEKASIEIESPGDGVLRCILSPRDTEVSAGDCVGIIAAKDEDITPLLNEVRPTQ